MKLTPSQVSVASLPRQQLRLHCFASFTFGHLMQSSYRFLFPPPFFSKVLLHIFFLLVSVVEAHWQVWPFCMPRWFWIVVSSLYKRQSTPRPPSKVTCFAVKLRKQDTSGFFLMKCVKFDSTGWKCEQICILLGPKEQNRARSDLAAGTSGLKVASNAMRPMNDAEVQK